MHADGQWTIAEEIRRATHWRKAIVLTLHEPGVWGMIRCRNLSIYLSLVLGAGLWSVLEASLQPSGVLVLGSPERPVAAHEMTLLLAARHMNGYLLDRC